MVAVHSVCDWLSLSFKRLVEAANRFLFRMWFSVLFISSIFGYAMRHVIMCQCDAVLAYLKAHRPPRYIYIFTKRCSLDRERYAYDSTSDRHELRMVTC